MAALLFVVAALGTAFPRDMTTFNVFRILGGIGVGLTSVVSPMYIAEMAPARLRGRLVSVNQLAIVIGLFSAIVVSYGLSFGIGWRWMFASECLPALAWLVLLRKLPESPRWLVEKCRETEALDLLAKSERPPLNRLAGIGGNQAIHDRVETGGWAESCFRPGILHGLR